jgi:DNA-binding NarL/FixJ family response regulator
MARNRSSGYIHIMNKINILLVEDEALVREGLHSLLKKEDFVREVYQAGTNQEFFEKMAIHPIDLILLDLRLQGSSGLDILTAMKKKRTQPRVIAVTGLEGVEVIIHLLKSGVNGIVFKLDGYKEILAAIRSVMTSGSYFTEKILKVIQVNAARWDSAPPVTLTFHEKELLQTIAAGMTTKEISQQLKMSEATAETYRIRLNRKLGASNTAALLAFAYKNGLL